MFTAVAGGCVLVAVGVKFMPAGWAFDGDLAPVFSYSF